MGTTSCHAEASTRDFVAPRRSPAAVADVLKSPGQALDSATRARMEPLFGADFSRVRVHVDDAAHASAASMRARAYTVGPHIVFGRGEHCPGTTPGAALIAHELAHVAQQHGRIGVDPQTLEIGGTRDQAERSAHAAAAQVLAGRSAAAHVAATGDAARPAIRRWSTDDISINVTPPNVPQDPDTPSAQREPVWCQFGGRDRGDECRPLQACQTTGQSRFEFLAIYRVDAPRPASPYPAALRGQPIEIEGAIQFHANSGGEMEVAHFSQTAAYTGQGVPISVRRMGFSSPEDGSLGVMFKVATPGQVVVYNGSVPCTRIPCV